MNNHDAPHTGVGAGGPTGPHLGFGVIQQVPSWVTTAATSAFTGYTLGNWIGIRYRDKQFDWVNSIVANDVQLLASNQPLPAISEEQPPRPRTEKGLFRCYATGILIGGFLAWLLTYALVAGVAGSLGNTAQAIVGAFPIAFGVGLLGFVVPGLPIGILLWLREIRERMRESAQSFRHEFWVGREQLRSALSTGQVTPDGAVALLRGEADWGSVGTMQPPPQTVTTGPAPQPGQPAETGAGWDGPGPEGWPPPPAGHTVDATVVLALTLALAESTQGFRGDEAGLTSTAAQLQRILTSPESPERATLRITPAHWNGAGEIYVWLMTVYEDQPLDTRREALATIAASGLFEPADPRVAQLAGAIGYYQQAGSPPV